VILRRCAWHAKYRGYRVIYGVDYRHGYAITFTDGICRRCAGRLREELATGVPFASTAIPAPIPPAAVALIGLGCMLFAAAPIYSPPPPPPLPSQPLVREALPTPEPAPARPASRVIARSSTSRRQAADSRRVARVAMRSRGGSRFEIRHDGPVTVVSNVPARSRPPLSDGHMESP